MFKLILGLLFIILGVMNINLAFKLKKSKDINLVKNNMVKAEKVKDKEGYLRFNIKANILVGTILVVDGIFYILAKYFVTIENISSILNTLTLISMFIYSYKLMFKAPKF